MSRLLTLGFWEVSMRHKDPELMKRISDFISDFYIRNDRTPSTTEIAKEMDICRSSAQNYLVAMDKEKMIEYKGGQLRIPMMGKTRHDRSEAPLIGSIPCGRNGDCGQSA